MNDFIKQTDDELVAIYSLLFVGFSFGSCVEGDCCFVCFMFADKIDVAEMLGIKYLL